MIILVNSNIKIANEFIPLASLPDIKIEQRKGETTFRVTVTVDAAFSSTIIAAVSIGASVAIKVGNVTYTGVVSAFGVRPGHSILQVGSATCAP